MTLLRRSAVSLSADQRKRVCYIQNPRILPLARDVFLKFLAKLWEQRKKYIKVWYKKEMRGVVWVDDDVETEGEEGLLLSDLKDVEEHVSDVGLEEKRLSRNDVDELLERGAEEGALEGMQEREDGDHEGTEELVEERGLGEEADDGGERGELDVGVGRGEGAEKGGVQEADKEEKMAVVGELGEGQKRDLAELVVV